MTAPIRVLVVDDSVVVRKVLTDALSGAPDLEVVGTAPNGRIALQKLTQLQPDAVTLDIEMPVMNGLETLAELRKTHARLPVVMCSTLTSRGASATLDALALGASDYVTKPTATKPGADIAQLQTDLLTKLRALCGRSAPGAELPPAPAATSAPVRPRRGNARIDAAVIGVSTGGPSALADLVPALPADLPVPILIVQHMPPVFTRMLAERLDGRSAIRVVEATDGEPVVAGTVYLAPGGRHLAVERRIADGTVRVRLNDEPPENSCRPAVDVLFRSAVDTWGEHLLGVVLTGMGQDGLRGSELAVDAGGAVLAQDEASSVVWGMPGFVSRHGLAEAVLPLDQMAAAITQRVTRSQSPLTNSPRPAAAASQPIRTSIR